MKIAAVNVTEIDIGEKLLDYVQTKWDPHLDPPPPVWQWRDCKGCNE